MDTRKITASDHNEILSLMKKMSDFFSSETIEYAQEKIDSLSGFVVCENNLILGFIVSGNTTDDTIKIYRMGVKKEYQGKGIGTILFQKCEKEAKENGSKRIELLTLGEHPDYPGYANTRRFYEKMGCTLESAYMDNDVEILMLTKKITE